MKKETIRSNGRKYTTKDNKDRFFFPEEYNNTYNRLKDKQKHTAMVLLNTGARINEARNILIGDINFQDKWIILRVTKAKAKKGETKGNGRPRYIPISTQFCKYLKKYKTSNKLDHTNYLDLLSTPAFNIGIKKAAKEAGIQNPNDFSAHSLRKTLETWLMALNVNDMKLVKHIGHDIKTAVSSYVSPDIFNMKQKWQMREIIGDLYANKN